MNIEYKITNKGNDTGKWYEMEVAAKESSFLFDAVVEKFKCRLIFYNETRANKDIKLTLETIVKNKSVWRPGKDGAMYYNFNGGRCIIANNEGNFPTKKKIG
jgi:hypothetical protein